MSFMYIKRLIFSCDLLSLCLAITNSNGDSASLWNMTLWIFTSTKLCLPAVNSIL